MNFGVIDTIISYLCASFFGGVPCKFGYNDIIMICALLSNQQDYIKESDNLVSLHDQIRDCDMILSQMETLLSGFQVLSINFMLNWRTNFSCLRKSAK